MLLISVYNDKTIAFNFYLCFLFQIHSELSPYKEIEGKISIMTLIIWQSLISSSLLSFSANASIFSASLALHKSVPPPSNCFPHIPSAQPEVSHVLVLTSALIPHFPQIFFVSHSQPPVKSRQHLSPIFAPQTPRFPLFFFLNQLLRVRHKYCGMIPFFHFQQVANGLSLCTWKVGKVAIILILVRF